MPSFLHSDPFYLYDSNSNLQKDGVWNQANQAVSLGNGFLIGGKHIGGIQDGSSTQEQIDLINAAHEAVKNRMPSGHTNANYKVKSDSDDDDTTNYIDTWNHVRNWWIRDGSLFALLMDDRANRMIHNGEWEKFQTDILIGSDQNGDQYYKVRPEEHHMEHLRTFCNQMGGDLWSPASQAEYDDLMERENSVCDKHAEVFQDGKIFGSFGTSSGRTEIYLNLHRDGYLNCPLGVSDQRSVQPVGTTGLSTKLSCPQQYKSDSNLLYLRSLTETTNTYYTTDAYFADNLNVNGMCDAPNSQIHEYAIFQRNEDFTCDSFDKPYAEENCWDTNISKFRFQKFVQNDMPLINKILGVDTNGVSQLQKDCVVATCNNDASKTGPPNDQRSKSEWNVDHCNQHRHVGFCRIRAFGCNKQDWNCVSNYHKSCGSRQYLTSSVSHWADNNVEEKINILGGKAAECDIAAAVETTQNDQKVLFISDKNQNDVETQDWIDSLGLDASQYSVEFSDWPEKDNIGDQCNCKCWDSGSDRVQVGNDNLDSCDSIETPIGIPGRHVFVASTSCLAASNNIGFNKTFTCQDDPVADCGCISGSVTATCTLSDNGFEASFILGDSTDVCIDSCCPVKDDSVFTNNNQIFTDDRTQNRQNCPLWKTGDSYNMTCNENFHISGDPTQTSNSGQKTISVEDVDKNQCFQPLDCVPNQCGCPIKTNGYCYGA